MAQGTTFVLQKPTGMSLRQRLLEAIRCKGDVEKAIGELVATNPTPKPATSEALPGRWRQVWSSQASNANFLQKVAANFSSNWQTISAESEGLENMVEFLPGIRLKAGAATKPASDIRTEVQITSAAVELGPLTIPLNLRGGGHVEQLYLDDAIRVSRGNKGSVFVHVREA
eukprot:SM000211S06628  [mRNA]  locus=s211:79558:81300:- [translate_table: standard]